MNLSTAPEKCKCTSLGIADLFHLMKVIFVSSYMDVLENTLVAMLYGNNWILGKQHHRNCWNLYSELTHTAGFLLLSLTFVLFTTFAGIELIFQQVSCLWLNLKLNSFVKILMKVDKILQHLTNPMLSKIQLNFPSMLCCQLCSTMYNVLTILSLRLCVTFFFNFSRYDGRILQMMCTDS